MISPIEFNLSPIQVDYILAKMPKGFSLSQTNLLKAREQRLTKKVSKYDASFQSNKQDIVEDKSKRIQRVITTAQKEQGESLSIYNLKKGIQLLQKFKSHPAFYELHTQGSINIDKIEAFFKQEGNLIGLKNQIQLALQKLNKNASHQLQDSITQLETHFQNVFNSFSNEPKSINKNIQNKIILSKTKEIQKKQNQSITIQEKRQLGQDIRELSSECLKGVWKIVQSPTQTQTQEDEELEFDIELLPFDVIRKLQDYVKNQLKFKKIKLDPSISLKSINQDNSYISESLE